MTSTTFDPRQYKITTHAQWEDAAEAWHRWGLLIEDWLGPATERMLDAARITTGNSVLDVAAGAGGQSLSAARRVGPTGRVLATDISPTILEYAEKAASDAGLATITTRELDGEHLDVEEGGFDAVISRVGLIYFPDQQAALADMRRALRPGGRLSAVVYSTADRNGFFSVPVGIIRRRAQLPPPLPGQPGPFSLGSPASPKALLPRLGSATSMSRQYRRRSGWPVRRSASPSNVSRSARCIKCSLVCPRPTGTPRGPRSARLSPSSRSLMGSSGPARCSLSPAPGEQTC